MPKVTKCSQCSSFFNSSKYANCPYCQTPAGTTGTPVKNVEPPAPKPKFPRWFHKRKSPPKNEQMVPEKEPKAHMETKPDDSETNIPPTFSEVVRPQEISNENNQTGYDDYGSNTTVPVVVNPPDSNGEGSLSEQIAIDRKTIGKYQSPTGESVSPVVGWLVGVKGAYLGQSFPLMDGKNEIGRSSTMDVKLLNDDSVSRDCVANIVFDTKAQEFSILSGKSRSLTYVCGSAVHENERLVLNGYEEIEFGNSGRNLYLFVPLCGENFQWSKYTDSKKKDEGEDK